MQQDFEKRLEIYKARRRNLIDKMPIESIAILCSAQQYYRNGDVEFPFRQESNFYYLTGLTEPEAVAVLIKSATDTEFVLFLRESDPHEEIWTGPRLGLEGAINLLGANRAFGIAELDNVMPHLLSNNQSIFYSLGENGDFDGRLFNWINKIKSKTSRSGQIFPKQWLDLASLIYEMRLFKSSDEIEIIKKAVDISVKAHKRLMKFCQPGLMEYQLEAEFFHECIKEGCRAMAYPMIVGGG